MPLITPLIDTMKNLSNLGKEFYSPLELMYRINDVRVQQKIHEYFTNELNILEENIRYRDHMPSKNPEIFMNYRQMHPEHNENMIEDAILKQNTILSESQFVFHAGYWGKEFSKPTSKVLSTSLNPVQAIWTAESNGTSFNKDSFDLLVLQVTKAKTHIYIFDRNSQNDAIANEEEVLFASGATIYITRIITINTQYKAYKRQFLEYDPMPENTKVCTTNYCEYREIPFRIIFGTIS